MAVTIKDVARETGLAISTISKYMNGGNVREENRKIIEEAIERVGYVPNAAARGMRTLRTYTVGLIIGGTRNQHTSTLISQIEQNLKEMGYSLVFIALGGAIDESGRQIKKYIDSLVDKGVDGILVTPTVMEYDYGSYAREKNVPIVLVEERDDKRQTDSVLVNCSGAAYILTEHLIRQGHRRIGILMGQKGKLTAEERTRGYLRAFQDYGIPVRKEYMISGHYGFREGYEEMYRLWDNAEKPTAVFSTSYELTLGALKAIHELQIDIPKELSLVTFDDFDMWMAIYPRLTAIRQPLEALAKEACEILYRRMNGDFRDFPQVIRLDAECTYRNSVKNLYDV